MSNKFVWCEPVIQTSVNEHLINRDMYSCLHAPGGFLTDSSVCTVLHAQAAESTGSYVGMIKDTKEVYPSTVCFRPSLTHSLTLPSCVNPCSQSQQLSCLPGSCNMQRELHSWHGVIMPATRPMVDSSCCLRQQAKVCGSLQGRPALRNMFNEARLCENCCTAIAATARQGCGRPEGARS